MKKTNLVQVMSLLVVLLLILTGCASKTGQTSEAKKPVETQKQAETQKPAEPAKPAYPQKPITVIVPYGAGGPVDLLTRTVGKYAEKDLGQSFVVKNVAGGGGETGFSQMLRSPADGYTMGAMTSGHITLTVMREASYNPVDDVQPVALVVEDNTFLVVRPDDGINTIDDLIKFTKENPKKFTIGTSGAGSSEHFAIIGLNKAAGIETESVHFGGSAEAKAAFLGGHVKSFAPSYGEATQLVAENKAKIIAVFAEKRLPDLPNVETFKEKGIDIVLSNIRGFAVPKGTPQEIVDKLAAAIKKATEDPEYTKEMNSLGLPLKYADGKEYARLIKMQYDTYKSLASELK